ncbi:hypothetical protein [Paraburkholderia sp. GAS206C]|uniref:hypothetical protein n=1 Tax=unclassified Paraburkholderia TaxID=2615204 RepID=UPI003D201AA5
MNDKVGARAVVGYGYEGGGGGAACFRSWSKETKQGAIDAAVADCRRAGANFCTVAWAADSTPERDQKLRQDEADKKEAEQRKAQADLLEAQQEQAERLKSLAMTTRISGPSIEITSNFIERKLQENKGLTITMTQHWVGGIVANPADSSTSFPANSQATYAPSVPCTIGGHDLRDLSKIEIDSYTNVEAQIKGFGGSGLVSSTWGDGSSQNISYAPDYPTLLIQFRKTTSKYDEAIKGKNYPADTLRLLRVNAKLLRVSVNDGDDGNHLASAITHAAELCGAAQEDANSPF